MLLRYSLLILTALVAIAGTLSAQPEVVTFTTDSAVYLRWKGVRSGAFEGYRVYRQQVPGEEWQRLTDEPLRRTMRLTEIAGIAGYKTDLYLGIFGAAEPPRDLTDADYDRVLGGGRDISFFEALAVVNPEFARLLGEIYADSTVEPGIDVRYRITVLEGGAERDVTTSNVVHSGVIGAIPAPSRIDGSGGNGTATIRWERNDSLMTSGTIVTHNVYRAEAILGPYERINTAGLLPVTVSTAGRAADEGLGEFIDRFLQNGRSYYYQVRSVNPFGFEGGPSAVVEIVPEDTDAPPPPTNIGARLFGTNIRLSWERPPRTAGVEVYRRTEPSGSYDRIFPLVEGQRTPDDSWLDIDVAEGNRYHYYLRSVGENGIIGKGSDTLSVFYPDETPPAPPQGVTAVGDTGRITIRWDANVEPDLLGYQVERASDDEFRSRFLLTDTPIVARSYLDLPPKTSQTTYGYVVYAIDRSYNRSAPSEMVRARMPDIVPPQPPIVTVLTVTDRRIVMTWTKGSERDLAAYRIYESLNDTADFRRIVEVAANSYEGRPDSVGRYYYAVTAVDSSGNEGARSNPASIAYGLDDSPPPPGSVSVERQDNHILVRWSASSEPVAGYVVTRTHVATNRTLTLEQPGPGDREFKDWYADPSAEYIYTVRSHDRAWRLSEGTTARYAPR